MSWFDSFKSFIENIFHISIRINSPEINIVSTTGKEAINIEQNGKKITVNINGLNKEQREGFDRIVGEHFQEEGEILTNNLENYSERFDKYEKNNPDKTMLKFFKDKIPKEDFEALRVSLFIRALYKDNENIFQVKKDVIKKFGERGKNITNLCSAGYFENFIKPLYEEIGGVRRERKELIKYLVTFTR
jgi:hypothetical protein